MCVRAARGWVERFGFRQISVALRGLRHIEGNCHNQYQLRPIGNIHATNGVFIVQLGRYILVSVIAQC